MKKFLDLLKWLTDLAARHDMNFKEEKMRRHRPYILVALAAFLIFTLLAASSSLENGSDDDEASGEVQLTFLYQRKDTNMVCLDGDMSPSGDPVSGSGGSKVKLEEDEAGGIIPFVRNYVRWEIWLKPPIIIE